MVHHKRYSENDFRVESACILGVMGVAPSVSVERRLSRYSKVGVAVSFAFPLCLLQAKFRFYNFYLITEILFAFFNLII